MPRRLRASLVRDLTEVFVEGRFDPSRLFRFDEWDHSLWTPAHEGAPTSRPMLIDLPSGRFDEVKALPVLAAHPWVLSVDSMVAHP